MKEMVFSPGDRVALKTREKTWNGYILESHDPEIVLLKLKSGYNIGIREREIISAKTLEKLKKKEEKKYSPSVREGKKNVALIITGGTISSRLDPKTGAVVSTDSDDILNISPEMSEVCNIIKIKKPFLKLSEDMAHRDWVELTRISVGLLNEAGIDGIIITHGTDTLSYTSSALSFFIRDLNKPVALTYSQRSIDRGSTDAHLNLICAAKYAVSDIAEVCIIGHENTNDKNCLAMPGTRTRKMHTSARDTFKIINSLPVARISKDKFEILREFNARDNSKKAKADVKYSDKVALIKIHPGMGPSILDYYKKEGFRGIILEVSGLGHVPGKESGKNWLPKIKNLISKGVFVFAAAQTFYGRLNPNVYSAGRNLQKTGIIFLEDMLGETAFVKLSWILGHPFWKNKVKEKMLENVAGEVSG